MAKAKLQKAVLIAGKAYTRNADGTLAPLADDTDYAALDARTSEALDEAARLDQDALPMSDEEWLAARLEKPVKVPVGLKLDDDVLGWFKQQGRGYQTRINAVLRRYMDAHRAG